MGKRRTNRGIEGRDRVSEREGKRGEERKERER